MSINYKNHNENNKMKKSFVYFGAAALMLVAGCNKENPAEVPSLKGQTIDLTLEAVRGEVPETRTSISYNNDNGTLDSRWAAGDKIYVYNIASGAKIGELSIDASTVVNESNSKASFKGSVTLSDISEKVAFLYQGKQDAELSAEGGLITYTMGTVSTVDGLAKWDIAYVQGNVQKSGSQYTAAVTLDNKMAFGYFTTEALDAAPTADYATSFTFNVKDGSITPVKSEAGLSLPKAKFYMPLIPGQTQISCGRSFTTSGSDIMVSETKQELAFNAVKGYYYRLSKYADTPYGPVPFKKFDARKYNVVGGSAFAVSASKDVHFTEGNLQWIGTAAGSKHWQIAPSQFDVVKTSGSWVLQNQWLPLDQDIDLFGWGAINDESGFMGIANNDNYAWGLTDNKKLSEATPSRDWADIFNNAGDDASKKLYADVLKGTEYTKPAGTTKYAVLTNAEWVYLFQNQWFAPVTVTDVTWGNGNNATGIVVAPKGASLPAAIETKFKLAANQTANNFADGSAAQADFQFAKNSISSSVISENGLLFLPAAGWRNGAGLSGFGAEGYYWSSVSSSATLAYLVYFAGGNFYAQISYNRYSGFSVRLAVASE